MQKFWRWVSLFLFVGGLLVLSSANSMGRDNDAEVKDAYGTQREVALSKSFDPEAEKDIDERDIWYLLDKLQEAILREDVDSIMELFSPNLNEDKRREIRDTLQKTFRDYDYLEYVFSHPSSEKIEILEPGKKVRFTTTYSEKWRSRFSAEGSLNGFGVDFVLDKVNGRWFIVDTNFYTRPKMWRWITGSLGFLLVLLGLVFVFWLWALVDCINRDFVNPTDKVVWVLVIICLQIIGALLYFFIGRRKSYPKGEFPR